MIPNLGASMMLRICWRGLIGIALFAAACGKTSSTVGGPPAQSTQSPVVAATASASASGANSSGAQKQPDLHLTVAGTIGGAALQGPVVPAALTCTPAGANLQINWSGSVQAAGRPMQISGDMNIKTSGTTTFPSGGTASVVLNGDYKNRVPATSGTATVGPDGKAASIDAQLASDPDRATVQGTLNCP